jgi:hypothetical protein
MNDLKFALRQLLKNPGFTAVAVLTLGILDLRFAICDWAAGGGNPGSSHDRGQFAGLLVQRVDLLLAQQAAVDDQFHPIGRFIRLLLDGAQLGDELGFGTTSTSCPVVRANGRSTSHQLGCDRTAFGGSGQGANESDDPQRKLSGTLLQFRFRHKTSFGFETTAMLCRQIANRKSKIANP